MNITAKTLTMDKRREPCSFYVTGVPPAVFTTDSEASIRPEFESVFRLKCNDVKFTYLKSFNRVLVTYPDPEQCSLAWSLLRGQEFRGSNLQLRPVTAIVIGSQQLELPQKTKTFLISPPASPPVGWEQSHEALPTRLDFNLVTAVASLRLPGEVQELHEASGSTPSIVVVTPEDSDTDKENATHMPTVCQDDAPPVRLNMNALPRHLVQTSRPPLPQSS